VAPALHCLNIHDRKDAVRIVGTLFDSHVDLRKLNLKNCILGADSTGILTNIVALYPNLEALSLSRCYPITSAGYSLIQRLKKLSELNLSHCEVHYVLLTLNITSGVPPGPQTVIFCDPVVTITTDGLLIFVCVRHQLKINIM
jgi:hypothetical protein